MINRREISVLLLTGFAVGAVVLGIVGRIAMVGVATLADQGTNLSWPGLLEVVLLGGLLGAVGGVLALPLRRFLRSRRHLRGFLLGVSLFVMTLFFLPWRTPGGDAGQSVITLSVVAVIFMIFGITFEILTTRSMPESHPSP